MKIVSLDSPSCEVPCLILQSVVYRDVTRQAKGLYRLKYVEALKSGPAYLSRCNSGWFCHSNHRLKTKQLLEIVSGIEIFMRSTLLKYKLTVKFQVIFIQQNNYEKYIKQLLQGSRSIYIEQTMQKLVLNILLSTPKLMVTLL
jgi:hypothetical protein